MVCLIRSKEDLTFYSLVIVCCKFIFIENTKFMIAFLLYIRIFLWY